MNRFNSGVLWLVLPGVTSMAFAAPPQYAVIDLGVQEAGQGLQWQPVSGSPITNYPGLGGQNLLYAFNSAAQVGTSATADQSTVHAARWVPLSGGPGATFTDLGVLPNASRPTGAPWSFAYGLNLVGDIVGQSDSQYLGLANANGYHSQHAFLWNSGVMTDLGAIAGNAYDSAALAVNDSHEIVGWTNTVSSVNGEKLQRAFIDIGGTMYNLSFYEVGGPTALLSQALSIDCQGNIAAIGYPATGAVSFQHNYLLVRQGAARTGCLK
jgi:probable HAF family extracellular repeat protein